MLRTSRFAAAILTSIAAPVAAADELSRELSPTTSQSRCSTREKRSP